VKANLSNSASFSRAKLTVENVASAGVNAALDSSRLKKYALCVKFIGTAKVRNAINMKITANVFVMLLSIVFSMKNKLFYAQKRFSSTRVKPNLRKMLLPRGAATSLSGIKKDNKK
jgi:hypothetical protein